MKRVCWNKKVISDLKELDPEVRAIRQEILSRALPETLEPLHSYLCVNTSFQGSDYHVNLLTSILEDHGYTVVDV